MKFKPFTVKLDNGEPVSRLFSTQTPSFLQFFETSLFLPEQEDFLRVYGKVSLLWSEERIRGSRERENSLTGVCVVSGRGPRARSRHER